MYSRKMDQLSVTIQMVDSRLDKLVLQELIRSVLVC
jgi:hypothetical protein